MTVARVDTEDVGQKKQPPSGYGPKLRELRERAGMSQTELAKRCGMAAPAINKLENEVHEPSWLTALKIAEALECPLDAFKGG